MHKETVTYSDYNGIERTEDFYFNLTEAEIAEMEYSETGSFTERLTKVVASKDQPSLIRIFKSFLLDSYGVRSDDGRRFMKSDAIRESFVQNPAYSILFMKFARDDKAAAAFVNGVMPRKLEENNVRPINP